VPLVTVRKSARNVFFENVAADDGIEFVRFWIKMAVKSGTGFNVRPARKTDKLPAHSGSIWRKHELFRCGLIGTERRRSRRGTHITAAPTRSQER
jgi:hypothetical protein